MSTKLCEPGEVFAAPFDLEPVPLLPRALPFDDPGWIFQPQYEGYRALLEAGGRSGARFRGPRELRPDRLEELGDRVAAVLGPRDAVLDGIVVALDRNGQPSLGELRRAGLLSFCAFDLVRLDGDDLRRLSLADRLRRLAHLLPADTSPIYKLFTLEEHGRALYQAARRMGLEGIVARRKQDPYAATTVWYVIRNPGYTRDDGRVDPFRPRVRPRRSDREGARP